MFRDVDRERRTLEASLRAFLDDHADDRLPDLPPVREDEAEPTRC